MSILAISFLFFSLPVIAATNLECNIAYSVGDSIVTDQKVSLALFDGLDEVDCLQESLFVIPGTQVQVTIGAHGRCNSMPAGCLNGPTVSHIEIWDRTTNNSSSTYGCYEVRKSMFLQFISVPVNTVVACDIKISSKGR